MSDLLQHPLLVLHGDVVQLLVLSCSFPQHIQPAKEKGEEPQNMDSHLKNLQGAPKGC